MTWTLHSIPATVIGLQQVVDILPEILSLRYRKVRDHAAKAVELCSWPYGSRKVPVDQASADIGACHGAFSS
jgi:hypothetical protein